MSDMSNEALESDPLPVFHITHWKAGSTWVSAVLKNLARQRYVERRQLHDHILNQPIVSGGIYSPVYMHRHGFLEAVTVPHRRFVVIRDLRDTLVSWYFSVCYSHTTSGNPGVQTKREGLGSFDQEQGMLHMMEHSLPGAAAIQATWTSPRFDEFIIRYEDMWADQQGAFERICTHIGIDVVPLRRQRIVEKLAFEQRSGGRKAGEEDVRSHFRKGVPGDWRNHFTPRLTEAFKERFGELLIRSGYEQSMDW